MNGMGRKYGKSIDLSGKMLDLTFIDLTHPFLWDDALFSIIQKPPQ